VTAAVVGLVERTPAAIRFIAPFLELTRLFQNIVADRRDRHFQNIVADRRDRLADEAT
jgi:hypothetical protein